MIALKKLYWNCCYFVIRIKEILALEALTSITEVNSNYSWYCSADIILIEFDSLFKMPF